MLYTNFTEKLLGLQDVNVTNVEESEKEILIYAELKRKKHNCICCGTATDTIHDYRRQVIKDIPAFGKTVTIVLRKRRYSCPSCGKRFFEENTFLPKYHRMTNRLASFVIDKLSDERSFTSVAGEVMLYYSVNISRAYFYKESFFKVINAKDSLTAKKLLGEWIEATENCGIKPFEKCSGTFRNWFSGIINSFDTNITNGFTECCNNKIKVLKRNAYGYRNFNRFRNRILHMFFYKSLAFYNKGLSHLDAESVFFTPKLYIDTASG